jgi:hypothetical protein
MAVIAPELRAWLRPGLAGMIATADATGRPELSRIWALRVDPDRDRIEVYVQRTVAVRLLQNLAHSERAALNAVEVDTYRSRLFKGRCAVSAAPIDGALLEACLSAMGEAFSSVGMPPDAVSTILSHAEAPRDMVGLVLEVDCVFDQSPKPGAGARL